MKTPQPFSNVDEYIAQFPEATQLLLQQMRATIRANAPEAEEGISYAMPTFKQHGNLVFFAGYKGHIGFYPSGSGIATFQDEISAFKWAKGSVQFPLDKPLPLDLVARITRFRVDENQAKAAAKSARKRKG